MGADRSSGGPGGPSVGPIGTDGLAQGHRPVCHPESVTASAHPLPLTTVRSAFLDAAGSAAALIADPQVASDWQRPSALDGMTVGALATHLATAVGGIDNLLDAAPPPGTRALSPDRYFRDVPTDLNDGIHRGVRARSLELAVVGPETLAEQVSKDVATLAERLALEPPDRRIRAQFGLDMYLDGYLVTRMVELTIHTDDLAVSVGTQPPEPSDEVSGMVIDCLVGVARRRHGDREVIRGLARQDRAETDTLKVF